jgi:hypothetical protein
MDSMEFAQSSPSEFGFYISPLTPPHVPDVLICRVDTRFKTVSLVAGPCLFSFVLNDSQPLGPAGLSSDVTPVSTRNLSRWLFLLARGSSSVRPIRPPAVYRSITVVGADIFVRCLAGIGAEAFPCDSPDPLPPGCYALFVEDQPYPYPIGQRMPRSSFAKTERTWDVPKDDFRAAYRMAVRVSPYPLQFPDSADVRIRILYQIISPATPGSATVGCAVLLAGPRTALRGLFPHCSAALLP